MAGGFTQDSPGSTMLFTNNTVADNMGGIYTGINCGAGGSSFSIVNSIVFGNRDASGNISDFNSVCSSFEGLATDDPTVADVATVDLRNQLPGFVNSVPVTALSYALVAGAACLDQGQTGGAPAYDYLQQPRPDTKTKKVDIGAFERQQ